MNIKSITKNVLFRNFSALTINQISNYIFPLITFPYLVRVLGPDKFGLVNFAAAFVGYFGIITDYGFNLSATREISIHRNDKTKIIEIFSSVILIKLSLFFISLVILLVILIFIPFFKKDFFVYLSSFGIVLGNALFPLWFFQGIENMKFITMINVFVKAVITVCIFLVVATPADYIILILINSLGFILLGILGFIIVVTLFRIKMIIPSRDQIIYQLKEGWHIFLSTFSISLYTITNPFILGLFAGNQIVGYYVAADKIRAAVSGIISIISQTVYPHIASLFSKSISDGFSFARKLLKINGTLSFIFSLGLFIFADEIVMVVLGETYLESAVILKIISWLIFVITLGNVSGIQVMLNMNFKKSFSIIITLGAVINLILSFVLVPRFYELGTSVSVLITEIFITVAMFISLANKKINLFKAAHV